METVAHSQVKKQATEGKCTWDMATWKVLVLFLRRQGNWGPAASTCTEAHSAWETNKRSWKSVHSHRSLTSLRLQRCGGTVLIIAKLQWVGAGWLGGTRREDECGAALCARSSSNVGSSLTEEGKGHLSLQVRIRGEVNKEDHCGGKLLQTTQSGRGGE